MTTILSIVVLSMLVLMIRQENRINELKDAQHQALEAWAEHVKMSFSNFDGVSDCLIALQKRINILFRRDSDLLDALCNYETKKFPDGVREIEMKEIFEEEAEDNTTEE